MKKCENCAHYRFVLKVFDPGPNPHGGSHSEHRCHALDGQENPVSSGTMMYVECSIMRFGPCSLDGLMFTPKR